MDDQEFLDQTVRVTSALGRLRRSESWDRLREGWTELENRLEHADATLLAAYGLIDRAGERFRITCRDRSHKSSRRARPPCSSC
jgi:hypothetical protein